MKNFGHLSVNVFIIQGTDQKMLIIAITKFPFLLNKHAPHEMGLAQSTKSNNIAGLITLSMIKLTGSYCTGSKSLY